MLQPVLSSPVLATADSNKVWPMLPCAASRLLSAMDATVDPCEDFFEYACGTWNRVHIIPDDKSSYNTFRKLGDELHAALKGCHCQLSQLALRSRASFVLYLFVEPF